VLKKSSEFKLIEVMIIVAIIVILSGLIIPNVIVKIQHHKIRSTIREINTLANYCLAYIKENGEAPAAGIQSGPLVPGNIFIKVLGDKHLMPYAINDRWGNPLVVYSGSAVSDFHGFIKDKAGKSDFIIVSYGHDGIDEGFFYDPANPKAGWFKVNSMADFKKDLINWNGTWIRRPQ
jgi:hypothetical protein